MTEATRNAPNAVRISLHKVSAWDEPAFRSQIERFGRKKVVLGGISLDICVLQTAHDLKRAG